MKTDISQADIMRAFLQITLDHNQAKMAEKLDVKASTLSNKVQPYDSPERRHYLTVWEADNMMEFSGDLRPLELWAARHGCVLVPLDVVPDAPTFDAEVVQDQVKYAEYITETDPIKQIHKFKEYIVEFFQTHKKRQEENGIKLVGFIVGHKVSSRGIERVLIPNEKAEGQQ